MSATFDWETEPQGDTGGNGAGAGDGGGNAVAELREAYKALKSQYKEQEKELSTLRVQTRTAAIRDTLSAKGVNPKIASFIPADIEPTPDAVVGWLTENADVFGLTVEAEPAEGVTADTAAAQQQIQSFVQGSTASPASKAQQMQARLEAATSKAELDAILAELR